MISLILILCIYIVWRLHKGPRPPRACGYYSHETTHTNTLIGLVSREITLLRKELKDAGVLP